MLRMCVLDLDGSWETHLLSVEISYNNSFQAIIGMEPYEALHGSKCRSLVYWDGVEERERMILGLKLLIEQYKP